jgi:hypothetical protein
MELFGVAEIAPPLATSLEGADFVLRWPATNHLGFILLSGTDLSHTDTWSPLNGPYLLNGGFYVYRDSVIYSKLANFYTLRYVGSSSISLNLGLGLNANTTKRSVMILNSGSSVPN